MARGIPSRGLTNKEMSSLIRYVTRPTHDNPNPRLYIDISQIDPRLVYRDGPTECIIIPKLLKQTDDVLKIVDSSDEEDEKEKNVREEDECSQRKSSKRESRITWKWWERRKKVLVL